MKGRASIHVVACSVRELRKKRGWSQEELGARADLHRTYIGAIERAEENLTLRTLDKLATALGVLAIELFRER